jgi:hypothetical protein
MQTREDEYMKDIKRDWSFLLWELLFDGIHLSRCIFDHVMVNALHERHTVGIVS